MLILFAGVMTSFVMSSGVQAVPYHGNEFTYYQPNGEAIQIRLFGDEFYAVAQTLNGYTIVRDPDTRVFHYADLSADGNELESTGIRVGQHGKRVLSEAEENRFKKLRKNTKINRKARRAKSEAMRRHLGVDWENRFLSEPIQPAPAPGDTGVRPEAAVTSARVGGSRVTLVLMAQFADRSGDVTITQTQIDQCFNAIPYTAFGNATSIRGYFRIQSNDALDLESVVTGYFTAEHPRDYYTDPAVSYGSRARELLREGLEALKAQNFDFTQLDGNNDGRVDAVNCLYAGSTVNAWSEGLWPHAASMSWQGFEEQGLNQAAAYQITNIGNTLSIGGLCHELGHAVVGLPDLYSYDDNAAGVGNFCLMSGGTWAGSGKHPTNISAPMKDLAGWATIVTANGSTPQTYNLQEGDNTFVRYVNPDNSQEYFMAEMRSTTGYEGPYGGHPSSVCPSKGLVLYHYLQRGSNSRSSIFTADNPNCDYSRPYREMVIENNPTTSVTPWYDNPSMDNRDAFTSGDVLTPLSRPALTFWSNSGRTLMAGIDIHSINVSTSTLSFVLGNSTNNFAPMADAQTLTIAENTPKAITLTGRDVNGDALTYAIVTRPSNGTLSGTGPDVTYTPASNFTGIDSFTFLVNDGILDSAIATVEITVEAGVSDVFGLLAEFFDYTAISVLPNLSATTPDIVRIDRHINYQSVNTAWPGLPSSMEDTFASRHTGQIWIQTEGDYTFYLNSDDGSKLWLDDQVLVDNDGLHAMRELSATISLSAGFHAIRVEFFENGGGAGLILSWDGPGFEKQVVPVNVLYQPGTAFQPGLWYGTVSGDIDTTTENPKNVVTISLDETEDSIAANTTEIYSGQIFDSDGHISFTEDIDDKTRLKIDGVLVISSDDWTDRVSTDDLALTPGWHDFELRISNGNGESGPHSAPGFGFDPNGGTLWVHPSDPGDGTLFRTSDAVATADRYEAEDAVLNGPVLAANVPGYSGTGFADYVLAAGGYVEWTVDAAMAGNGKLVFGYALDAGDRPLEIQVNGVVVASRLSFPGTGAWDAWGTTVKLNVELQPGANTVRATAIGSSGANLDYLDVSIGGPGNIAPIADSQNLGVCEDESIAMTLTGRDADGDILTYTVVEPPSHGTLSGLAPDVLYTPMPDYNGPDSFTFVVDDGSVFSADATVSIGVTPIYDGGEGDLIWDPFDDGVVMKDRVRVTEGDIDEGWQANASVQAAQGFPESAWTISDGTLQNTNTSNSTAGEGALVQVVSVMEDGPYLTIGFDYVQTGNDTLYVHLWGFTGALSDNHVVIGNLQGANGSYVNLAEDVEGAGAVNTYNLRDGSNPASGSPTQALAALTGSGHFYISIEVADLGIAGVDSVGDFQYLSLAFARNTGSSPGSVSIDDLLLTTGPGALGTAMQKLNFSYVYYEKGHPSPLRGRRPQSEANLAARADPDLVFQTGYYSLMLDADDVQLTGYDALAQSDYRTALEEDVPLFTPAQNLSLSVVQDEVTYTCVTGVVQQTWGDQVRLIESGQYVQRIDHLGLVFKADNGDTLVMDEDCRLEMTAWPDRVTFFLDFSSETNNPITRTSIQLISPASKTHQVDVWGNQAWMTIKPHEDVMVGDLDPNHYITQATRTSSSFPLYVAFDRDEHAFRLEVPAEQIRYPQDRDRMDEYVIEVTNPFEVDINVPLVFLQPKPVAITGTSMLLCDGYDGRPLGIPVQISKNWHRTPGSPTAHEGPWLRGSTMLALAPHESRRFTLRVVYGYWGGAGAVSHAQLCLIGYGGNWRWEESALGAWGESITYDPTLHLGGAFMGDIRPAFTTSYSANRSTHNWTENVGASDFLTYRDSSNRYHRGKRLKTCFLWTGPSMTEVLYSGVTDDERIRFTYAARSAATLDYHRRFHSYRYEFLQDVVSPQRLVFFQMAADYYAVASYDDYYIGDETGVLTAAAIEPGGNVYKGSPIPFDDKWLSVHDTKGGSNPAKALRGLMPMSSTLNGDPLPLYLHKYGRNWGGSTMLFDLASVSTRDSYTAGDVVQGELELVMPPQHVDHYWGDDIELINRLTTYGNAAWETVWDEFKHNMTMIPTVHEGTMLRTYPLEIQPQPFHDVLADFTIPAGGIGHLPVLLRGAEAGLELKAQRWLGGTWIDLESADVYADTYYQGTRNPDGSMDYVFTIPRPMSDLNHAWRIRILRYRTGASYEQWVRGQGLGAGDAYDDLEALQGGGSRLRRDDEGLRRGAQSAWTVVDGALANFSREPSKVAEGACARMIDVRRLRESAGSRLQLEFDYTMASSAETLFVHLWGYVDVESQPTTHTLNLESAYGNAWESSKSAMQAYNLAKPNGLFSGIPGAAADAAVTLTGVTGRQHYSGIFDLSEFSSAPSKVDGYDYLVLGFTRRVRGVQAPGVLIENVVLSLPDNGGTELWTFRAGQRDDDPLADPDGDGMANFYEYAMGGVASSDADTGYPVDIRSLFQGGTNYIEYIYPRRMHAESLLRYYPLLNTNLAAGAWTPDGCEELPGAGPIDAEFETVTNRVDTLDKDQHFIRLMIEPR